MSSHELLDEHYPAHRVGEPLIELVGGQPNGGSPGAHPLAPDPRRPVVLLHQLRRQLVGTRKAKAEAEGARISDARPTIAGPRARRARPQWSVVKTAAWTHPGGVLLLLLHLSRHLIPPLLPLTAAVHPLRRACQAGHLGALDGLHHAVVGHHLAEGLHQLAPLRRVCQAVAAGQHIQRRLQGQLRRVCAAGVRGVADGVGQPWVVEEGDGESLEKSKSADTREQWAAP